MNPELIERARELGSRENGLAVVVTCRANGSLQASVVNAGFLEHPVTGLPVLGFVARGGALKLSNLRERPRATVVFRSDREWVAIEGRAELVGPDDPREGLQHNRIQQLLRTVYASAVGGSPDSWAHLDSQMTRERHTAVLIRPSRTYSNP